jgi:hypothetical protein
VLNQVSSLAMLFLSKPVEGFQQGRT